MTKTEIKELAKDLRADLLGADEMTTEIIVADLHRLDAEAKKQGFTIMGALTTNGFARLNY